MRGSTTRRSATRRRASRRAARSGARSPFLRRHLGSRLRLRRIPELQFFYDENIERLDRVERILHDLETERAERAALETEHAGPDTEPAEIAPDGPDAAGPDHKASTHNEQDDDR